MQQVVFTVPGKPQGKARARTYRNNGITRTVTPEKTVLYENFIKERYLQASKGKFFDKEVPVQITVTVRFAPPKNTSNKRYARMIAGKEYPLKKPDIDNVLKVICDALNGVAYHDDSQIIFAGCRKEYSVMEGLEVRLFAYKDGADDEG